MLNFKRHLIFSFNSQNVSLSRMNMIFTECMMLSDHNLQKKIFISSYPHSQFAHVTAAIIPLFECLIISLGQIRQCPPSCCKLISSKKLVIDPRPEEGEEFSSGVSGRACSVWLPDNYSKSWKMCTQINTHIHAYLLTQRIVHFQFSPSLKWICFMYF